METQINVAADGAERVPGRRNVWTDGQEQWWNVRIPKQANSEPTFNDYDLQWDLAKHVDSIGMTGWDWQDRCSRFVRFDFDHITGHAAGIGLSTEALADIRKAAEALAYVETRKSTSGKGIHLYVLLDAVPTANHTEHAALARAVLTMMANDTGFDFASQIDACGGNMWFWSRRATAENQGFALLKASSQVLSEPAGWRDHLDVVTRKRTKVRVGALGQEHEDAFEALVSGRKRIPLDAEHRALIDQLNQSGYSTIWLADYHLLQTHTKALEAIPAKGIFQTLSHGTDPGSPNCFAFPVSDGAWKVYRFSPGLKESATWEQGSGWTSCYYNRIPDLATAATAFGGVKGPKDRFDFQHAADAASAMQAMGSDATSPDELRERAASLTPRKDGTVAFTIERNKVDIASNLAIPGWTVDRKHFYQECVIQQPAREELDVDEVRTLITTSGEYAGAFIRSDAGTWDSHPIGHAKMVLQYLGYSKQEAESYLGRATRQRWIKVNLPFQPEYPGDRQWNKDAAKLLVQPIDRDEANDHPHWDLILNHCGQSLNEPLKGSGGDYLAAWIACLIRDPFCHLPYLFFHGPENSGKSILWEACQLLFTGIVKADRALTSQSDFNGELANAVLCVVEEKDISKSPGALHKLRDAVTSPILSIRKMRTDTYTQPNTTHWMHMSNTERAVDILPGDTRITVCEVLKPKEDIPKHILLERLKAEAPSFMRTLFDMELPPIVGRLRLSVVETQAKQAIAEQSNPVAAFIRECCIIDPHANIVKADLYAAYVAWCNRNGEEACNNRMFSKMLKGATERLVTIGGHANTLYMGIGCEELRPLSHQR